MYVRLDSWWANIYCYLSADKSSLKSSQATNIFYKKSANAIKRRQQSIERDVDLHVVIVLDKIRYHTIEASK